MDRIQLLDFDKLSGVPQRVGRGWDVVARAGINGSACWSSGDRGEPFVLKSEEMLTSMAAAAARFRQYQELEKQPPVTISFGGLVEGLQQYKVLKVTLVERKAIIRGTRAGDTTHYQALLIADWLLLPIDPALAVP